jgi:hypothetical protein
MTSLRLVRDIVNNIMRAWHLEALAEVDGWISGGKDLNPDPLPMVVLHHPLPKIKRDVWQVLANETQRLRAAIESQGTPEQGKQVVDTNGPGRSGDRCTMSDTTNQGHRPNEAELVAARDAAILCTLWVGSLKTVFESGQNQSTEWRDRDAVCAISNYDHRAMNQAPAILKVKEWLYLGLPVEYDGLVAPSYHEIAWKLANRTRLRLDQALHEAKKIDDPSWRYHPEAPAIAVWCPHSWQSLASEVRRLPDKERLQLLVSYIGAAHAQIVQRYSTVADRLRFDQQTLTVFLDGRPIKVNNPKAFLLYKIIAENQGPITRSQIRTHGQHFKGDKTVPRLLKTLPPVLRHTVQSSRSGYWVVLPEKKSANARK